MVALLPTKALFATHFPHSIPSLSTDGMILLGTILVFAYGVVAGYTALVRESISVYVGLVLANSFGTTLYNFLMQSAGGKFPVTETAVRLVLLIAPIVLLQLTRRHGHAGHKHNMVVTLILAAFSALLIISSVLSQLPQTSLSFTLLNSNLASWIYNFRLLWLAAVPVTIAVVAILHPHVHRRHSKV